METKICSKCNIEKPVSNYHKHGSGFKPYCKKCSAEYNKIYYLENREKINERNKKNITEEKKFMRNIKKRAYKRNVPIDVILEEESINSLCEIENKKYCFTCKRVLNKDCFGKLKITKDGLNTICLECRRTSSKEYITKNSEKIYENKKEYIKNNMRKILDRQNKWVKNKKKTDEGFRILCNIRNRLGRYFKSKGTKKISKRTIEMIGCSCSELREHIEKKFTEGMNWNNYGKNGWHVDHIIPLSSAKNEEEMIKLNHYTNLQPLWAIDNIKKGKKIIG